MIGYESGYAPVYSRRFTPVRLSQAAANPPATPVTPPSKLTPGVIRGVLTGGLVIETALGAAGTWVGLFTGSKASGLLSILGYTVGAVSAVSGIVSLAELVMYIANGLPVPTVPEGPPVAQPAVPISQ